MADYAVSVSLGGVPNPTGWYSVKAYGAVGDGVTNDITAIQAAIDAAEAAGGGVVFFPSGTYKISGGFNVDMPNVTLIGSWSSIISSSVAESMFHILPGAYNILIDGLAFATTATTGFVAGRAAVMVNAGALTPHPYNITVINCKFSGLRHSAIGGGPAHNIAISNNTILDIGEHGIYISDNMNFCTISGNIIDGVNSTTTDHAGMKICGVNVAISGNSINGMTSATGACSGIAFERSANHCSASGNIISGCTEGIRVGGISNLSISGNIFRDNTLHGYWGDITIRNNYAAEIKNISVVGNTFFGSSADGNSSVIYYVDTGQVTNFLVSSNTVGGTYTQFIGGTDLSGFVIGQNIGISGGLTTVKTAADGDATPTVSGATHLLIPANTAPTAITQLDGSVAGQQVTLVATSATNPSTIADSGNFALSAAWAPGINDTITLFTVNGTAWREISRSDN